MLLPQAARPMHYDAMRSALKACRIGLQRHLGPFSFLSMQDALYKSYPKIGSNPLPPNRMKPAERRAELCGILALGLIRLQLADRQLTIKNREISLHSSPDLSVHATPSEQENA